MRALEAEGRAWVDGRYVCSEEAMVALDDPAVQAGLGVFETIAVRGGLPVQLAAHLSRLGAGASRLGVALPATATLVAAASVLAHEVAGGHGWLKILALRSGRSVVFAGRMDPSEEGRSVGAVLLPWRRSLCDPLVGLKTLNYAALILGLEEARRRGADEGIWLNTRGHLAEACSSNLFVVSRGKIYTPSLRDGILPGITRGCAIEAARRVGLRVHEGKIRLLRLERADEAFLTSSLRAVRPLVVFDGRPVGRGRPGPVTGTISEEVARLRGGDLPSPYGDGA